jgi:hypothetical protein
VTAFDGALAGRENRYLSTSAWGAGGLYTDRRRFLKAAGIGSVAIAATPSLIGAMAGTAGANREDGGEKKVGFFFQSVSKTGGPPPTDLVILSGAGNIEPSEGAVEGGGFFTHFDNTTPVPKTIIASGSWRARELISWVDAGDFGVDKAGRLKMNVQLRRLIPSRDVFPGEMTVTCNIGAAGLAPSPPSEEGVELEVNGVTFEPALGLTVFTNGKVDID